MSRIFISHSSANNPAAIALHNWLAEEGWDDVFLDLDPERGLKAGERWQEALKNASARCEAVIFLISPDWVQSKWCLAEFLLARQMNKRIFGILIEPTPLEVIPAEMTSEWQILDLKTGTNDYKVTVELAPGSFKEISFSSERLNQLRLGLVSAGLDPIFFQWPPETDPHRAPYRGLQPLEEVDAGIFFGREAQVLEVLDRLRGLRQSAPPRFLAIIAASGAGKSSFMRAGLLPRLRRDRNNFFPLPVIRPERAPLTGENGLIASVEQALISLEVRESRANIRHALNEGPEAIGTYLKKLVSAQSRPGETPPQAVLLIDQGEELLSEDGGAEAKEFMNLLAKLVVLDSPAVTVVISIRSDSYEALQLAPELEGIRQETYSLPPMPKGAYAQLIEKPLARLDDTDRSLKIDHQLVDQLLNDLDQDRAKDSLPLLAFTLERLYREHGGSGRLELADYEALGRTRGAIEAAIEEVFRQADSVPGIPANRSQRLELLRKGMIPWLAGVDPDNGTPRRRISRASEIPGKSMPLIELLIEKRLLSSDIDPETNVRTIEPAHEALLRQWGLLEGWLMEDRGDLSMLDSIKRAARDWNDTKRDPAWLLHSGSRLSEAERVINRHDFATYIDGDAQDYLSACAAKQMDENRKAKRTKSRQRVLLTSVAGLILLVMVSAGLVGNQMEQAQNKVLPFVELSLSCEADDEAIIGSLKDYAATMADHANELVYAQISVSTRCNACSCPLLERADIEEEDQPLSVSADEDRYVFGYLTAVRNFFGFLKPRQLPRDPEYNVYRATKGVWYEGPFLAEYNDGTGWAAGGLRIPESLEVAIDRSECTRKLEGKSFLQRLFIGC